MNIHEHMAEKAELAAIYAQDGDLHSAARVLRKLAEDLESRAKAFDDALSAAVRAEAGK